MFAAQKHSTEETHLVFDGVSEHYYKVTRLHYHGKPAYPWYIKRADGWGNDTNFGSDKGYKTVKEAVDFINRTEMNELLAERASRRAA